SLPRSHGALGRYVLLRVLGHGGFGVVWEAYDPVLDRKIAVKLLMPSAAVRGQIVTEAQALARVHHPNVVAVFDAGVEGAGNHELAFIAMELVVGRTLRQWLADSKRSRAEVLDHFLPAARALDAAHAAGLVHRDFKPSNVLLGDDGRVRVSDFGLAIVDGVAPDGSPASNSLAGTPRYMAPEQLDGAAADARSDQFAFCVSLYEALFGTHPFAAGDVTSTAELRRKLAQPPLPPPRARATARIASIVMRGLAADPAQRWPSMRALVDALERARRSRALLVAAAACAVAVVAGAATLGWMGAAGPPRACRRAADAALENTWAPAHKSALAAQFGTLGARGADVWRRVAATLDDWSGRWHALRVEACAGERSGGRQSATSRTRSECLDRRIGELAGLVGALDHPDNTVASYAVRAANSLTAPESCLAAMPLPDGGPPPRTAAAPVRAQIDRALALARLHKQTPALAEARVAAEAADKLAWTPLVAEAQLQLGRSLTDVNAPSLDAFYRALSTAEKVRDDDLRFKAVMGLFKASLDASDYALAAQWHGFAAAISSHMPADGRRDMRLAYDDVLLARNRGQRKECAAAGQRALTIAEKVAPESEDVIAVLLNLSRCTEDEAAAVGWLKRALTMSEKVNGHQDAQTANVLTELGIHERRAGHHEAALSDYREALAVREADVGPDNPDCATVHNNISNLLRDSGRYDEARAEIERAVDIWTRAWGPESPAVAQGLSNVARIALAQKRTPDAEALLRRALDIWRKKRPPRHPDVLDGETMLAQALLAEHKAEALPLFEDALAGVEQDKDASELDRADSRFWVARARVELGVHAAGALAMATAACKAVAGSKQHDSATACPGWLAAHHAAP
ncbi:MAG: serine/threonine-protein kinase, partial [Polyangia bacterium]